MSQREQQIIIQKLEQDNESKEIAIEKAHQIIEVLSKDLERTKSELLKCESQFFKQKPKTTSEREKKLLQQVDDLNQHCVSLQQQLIEVSQQFKMKEQAFQNALIALEQKEILIEELQSAIQQTNLECEIEKENVQKEMDFVKRITENLYRSDLKTPNILNMDNISQIVRKRTGHSSDNSLVLTDASNIYINRNKSIQSRKHTAKRKTQDYSSFCQEEDLNNLQQHVAHKYINYATNDFDWEQTLTCFSNMKKKDLKSLTEKLCKRDYLSDVRCQLEQWQMRCSELETRNCEAIQKAEILSQLLMDMQFSFEYLKRNKNNLIVSVFNCLKRIVDNGEFTYQEIESLTLLIEEGFCPEIVNLGEFNLSQFHDLIMNVKQMMIRKHQKQILRDQNYNKKDFEKQNLEGHLDNLALQLNTYRELYHELIDKIVDNNSLQLKGQSPQKLQSLQRQAKGRLEEFELLNFNLQGTREQLSILDDKMRIILLELKEAQHQNLILQNQLIKEEKEVRILQNKMDDRIQLNKQLELDNLQCREDLINIQQHQTSNMCSDAQELQENNQLKKDIDYLTEERIQTMNLLNNALNELEQVQRENERLCDKIHEPNNIKTQEQQEEFDQLQHRIKMMTQLLDEKNEMIQNYQSKQSKKNTDRNYDLEYERFFIKMRKNLEDCIRSQCQIVEPDLAEFPRQIRPAIENYVETLNQFISTVQTIMIQDMYEQFVQLFEDHFEINIKSQMRDLQVGKDGLNGFIKVITQIKEEIIQVILVQQSSIKYQESINNQSDLQNTTKIIKSNRVSTLPAQERVSVMSQNENSEDYQNKSEMSQESGGRPNRVGGKIQRNSKSIAQQYTNVLSSLASQWIEQTGSCDKSLLTRLESIVNYCRTATSGRGKVNVLAKKSVNCLVINCFLLITLVKQWKEGMLANAEIFFEVSTNFSDIVCHQNITNKEQLSRMQMKFELFQSRVDEIIENITLNSLSQTIENHLQQLETSAQELLQSCQGQIQ